MVSIVRSQGQFEQEYYSISCINIGIKEDTDISLGKNWRGAFPKALFESRNWDISKKLEIKVETEVGAETPESEEYPNNIKFSSPQFTGVTNSEIIGAWDYETTLDETNNTGAIVKLTRSSSTNNIYLLLDLEQGET